MVAKMDQRRRSSLLEAERLETMKGRRKSSVHQQALERATHAHLDVVELAELSAADRKLAELGYKQVYKREFSWLSCISFAFSISGLFASVTTTYSYPLYAGGAASAVWCWLISGFGCMCIALSVSEICSAYPTSGGMYFTLKYLAPERWVPEISWLCGWLTVIGQIAGLASTEFGTAQLVLAAASIGTNFSYVPTTRQTVGVMAGLLIFHGILNSLSTRWLERITRGYVIFHLAVLISCAITLLVMTKDKHSTSYVWTDVSPSTGWTPAGFSFLFGFLAVSWTMTDYDATAHIAEEIKNPEIKAPWAITLALGFTWIGGWLFTIVLTYCCGDIDSILASPIEQPVAQIFYNVMGYKAAAFFTACAAVILNFTGMTGMQSGARAVWAVARDEMLPGSRIWVKINSKTYTPIWAVWLVVICCILINLIALGSYLAIAAIFSITAIAFDWSYCIPIICKMMFGRFEPGPFYLGKFGFIINFWAVAWTAFASVIFIFPGYKPVTAENMNYACVMLGATFIFAVGYWYAWGRHVYIGPRVNVELVDGLEPRKESEETETQKVKAGHIKG